MSQRDTGAEDEEEYYFGLVVVPQVTNIYNMLIIYLFACMGGG